MKKTRIHMYLGLALTAVLFMTGIDGHLKVQAKPSLSELEEEEKRLEQKRKNAVEEIKSLKSDIESVGQKIKELQGAKSNLQDYINQLDKEANTLASQIQTLEQKIEEKEQEIEAKKQELAEAEAEADLQYQMMKKRICYLYERGEQSLFVLLLESKNMSDMLNRAEYAFQISQYDQQMKEKLKAIRDGIAECKAILEQEQEEQKILLSEVEAQKAAIDQAIQAKTQQIASYQEQITSASGEQGEYKAQLREQEALLEKVESQIASVAAAKAEAADGDGGASGFVWPCPASHRITSGYGEREAPVEGASTYHRGLDIGASSGSAIVASAAGRVTTATYSSSAGNYVVISHGGGISTVYMHASALYVSEGEKVSKGQKIAGVGSTGFSTGPHLHFGIIVNGSYVNPLSYVN